jgi:hypothetical protein
MKPFEVIQVLNRLLRILCRSLPMYLADAKPWVRSEDAKLHAALSHLVADRQMYAKRLAEAIESHGGRPDPGRFPTEFTAKNDLSLEFLLIELIEDQELDVAAIAHYAAQLAGDPALHALAEEILGNARGHLDILVEIAKDHVH